MSEDASPPPDPLEQLRKMWQEAGMPAPGMPAPTLDTEELERHIDELRTVGQWLRMNLELLEQTIGGLEAQRAAITGLNPSQASAARHAPSPEPRSASPPPRAGAWPQPTPSRTRSPAGTDKGERPAGSRQEPGRKK